MGISSEMRDSWAKRRESLLIASAFEEDRIRKSRECTQEGVRAGTKAAAIACVASAIPTLVAVRTIPWAKANLNYTAQALIISGGLAYAHLDYFHGVPTASHQHKYRLHTVHSIKFCNFKASIAAYFITADKTILECARRNTQYDKSASA